MKGFNLDAWREHRDKVMLAAVTAKFSQNVHIYRYLMSTYPYYLAEARYTAFFCFRLPNCFHLLCFCLPCSPSDLYWGTGRSPTNEDGLEELFNPATWPGSNHLGEILTKLRDSLMKNPPLNLPRWEPDMDNELPLVR